MIPHDLLLALLEIGDELRHPAIEARPGWSVGPGERAWYDAVKLWPVDVQIDLHVAASWCLLDALRARPRPRCPSGIWRKVSARRGRRHMRAG